MNFTDENGEAVPLDLDRLISSRMLIQANSGGGKSHALRYLLEQTNGQVQQIILDPEGEFASLREHFDYLLCGEGGDVPATPDTARVLARRVMELGVSTVINLYDLPKDARRKFVRLFLEELMHLPRDLWKPLLVAIDEAHDYCPERGAGEAESSEAVKALCTQGRKRGYAAILATQRIAKLHKDAAAELLNKLIGRTGLDVDVKRAGDELGLDQKQRLALKHLAPGEFYVFGPAISREVVLVKTGEVLTTHPEPGKIAPPPPPAPEAIRALAEQLKDLSQQSEDEARDLQEAQEEIRFLKDQLVRARKETVEVPIEVRVEVPVLSEEMAAQFTDLAHELIANAKDLHNIGEGVLARIGGFMQQRPENIHESAPNIQKTREMMPNAAEIIQGPRASTPSSKKPLAPGNAKLSVSERKVLTVLAQFPQGRAKTQIALLAGYSSSGGSFGNTLGALRTKGFLSGLNSGIMQITEAGEDALGSFERLPQGEALVDYWCENKKLGKCGAAILRRLISVYPQRQSREELGAATGYEPSGGSFGNMLGTMRTLELIDGPNSSMAASAVFFE